MMSAHGLLGKMLMYEQSAAVPYLVRVPGISSHHFSQPVSHIDFVPTMLDLLGKPPHPQCAGKSKASVIRGESAPADFVFLEWSPGKTDILVTELGTMSLRPHADEEIKNCLGESTRAVVSPDGWKLCLRDKDKNEFYNLRDDPDERHNLYYGEDHRDVIAQLAGEIHRWQQRTSDTVKV
jgi:choline-sulfatase